MSTSTGPQGGGSSAATSASRRSTTTKRPRGPASEEAILGLRYITAAADCSSAECAICLQDFDFDDATTASTKAKDKEEEDTIRALPYSHAFHHRCISRWLCCNAVCPLCRDPLERPSRKMRRGILVFHSPYVDRQYVIDVAFENGIILEDPPAPGLPPLAQLNPAATGLQQQVPAATGLQQQVVAEDEDDEELSTLWTNWAESHLWP